MILDDITYPVDTGRTTRRWKLVKFLTHLICIGMLFVLPEILSATGKPFRTVPELRYGVYCKALIFIGVFYLNYGLILGRSLERKRFAWRLIGYNLIVTAAALTLFWLISLWMQPYWNEAWRIRQAAKGLPMTGGGGGYSHAGWFHWLKFFSRDFVMLVLTIGLSVALKLSDNWVRLSRREERLQDARRQEELKNLKSQLNPHFLFNTLNSIYALISVSPGQAQDAVHELSGMLRYVLYDDRREVELGRELSFVENYVKLMALRLPESTRLVCVVDAGRQGKALVPPLLFIPLVENAFKHSDCGTPGSEIEIRITASDDAVTARIVNSVAPSPKTDQGTPAGEPSSRGGIGLRNLRRRLQLIYGERALLATESGDHSFQAVLTIPLTKDC